jgi:glycosyltransferase involved in cell wall biosynthesis
MIATGDSRANTGFTGAGEKPLITVGIVTLNREWSIGCVLRSLLEQTYPHRKIYVVVVDGCSADRTVEVASSILTGSDFSGYKVIVRKTNIPEARNVCIDEMRGEALLFWDSDVVMEPEAIEKLVHATEEGFDIVSAARITFYVNSEKDVCRVFDYLSSLPKKRSGAESVAETTFVTMGHTLISKRVLEKLRFDPDLTFGEDADYSARARLEGFKVGLHRGVIAVDVNVAKGRLSDIYVYAPIRVLLKGLRKKARAKVLTLGFEVSWKNTLRYFASNPRYAFYLGYAPLAVLAATGLLARAPAFLLPLPLYALFYIFYQLPRRGLSGALRAFAVSVLVGVPLAALMVYYTLSFEVRELVARKGFRRVK